MTNEHNRKRHEAVTNEHAANHIPRRQRRRLFSLLGVCVALSWMLPLVLRHIVATRYIALIYADPMQIGAGRTAIVFGAAIRNGYPTTVLRDRLDAAISLYQHGLVDRLLLSGDGREASHDEPGAMARYAVAQGVPESALILDRVGLRTYDTCYRAREVYGLQQVVLVTQRFHLPRALFTCERLGIDAVGLSADRRTYRNAFWYDLREMIAIPVAAWDTVVRPAPASGLEP